MSQFYATGYLSYKHYDNEAIYEGIQTDKI